MIKFEVDSERVGGTKQRPEWAGDMKCFECSGSGEQLTGEMGIVMSKMFSVAVGGAIVASGAENFETFCDMAEMVGKTILVSALVHAAMGWAKEHDVSVEMEDLTTRFAQSLNGVVREDATQDDGTKGAGNENYLQ